MFRQSSYSILDSQPLNVNFLVSGATLWCAVREPAGDPIEGFMWFLIKRGSSQKVLSRLNDLEGAVRITSEVAALQYVRLLTAPCTFFMWHSSPRAAEIIEQGRVGELPNYGVKDYKLLNVPSGFMGVLSKKAFADGHFSAAVAHPVKGGFVISRWLLMDTQRDSPLQVALVQEEVSYGGAYRRRILNAKPEPRLPSTRWSILTFE